MNSLTRLMTTAVAEGVFPGGVLLVSKLRKALFHQAFGLANIYKERSVTLETLFDLASLTKPLATTLAVIKLIAGKAVKLQDRLGSILPQLKAGPLAEVTLEDLLAHRSGLPDYRPFYRELQDLPPTERKERLNRRLSRTQLVYPTGTKTLYSDLGFMVLRWVIEHLTGTRFDHFVQNEIYAPLGLDDLFFIDLNSPAPKKQFAATEACPWRKQVVAGAVHDENAYVLGGVDGHAGLFGTASQLHELLGELLSLYRGDTVAGVLPMKIVRQFLNYGKPYERALGFDRPSAKESSSGIYFSKNSVGHLGFTGVSFWMDLDRSMIVILLSNRIHPTRQNEKIKLFRPLLHDAVMNPEAPQDDPAPSGNVHPPIDGSKGS